MQLGTVSPATFEWIVPNFQEVLCRMRRIRSPHFHLPDSSWYLCLNFDWLEWIGITLCRGNTGASKTIKHTIKFNGRADVIEITGTTIFQTEGAYSKPLCIRKSEVASYSKLIITCYMQRDTSHPVAGRDFVTCAVQTEATNSMTEKENPKDKEWSSLDMKGVSLLSESMKELFIKSIEPDLTICVQDKEFRAHRSILSARSPVFAMMLAHDTKENNTGTITIEDCDPESFDEFLLYLYSGRTENLTPGNALRLYYPADKYDFPVLKELCVSLLKSSLSIESICDIVLLAAKHQEKELLEVATEFFARNMKKIVATVGWKKFLSQNLMEANELIIKSMEILQPEN